MGKKIMIFAGAPEYHALDWEGDDLLHHFLTPLATFAGLPENTHPVSTATDLLDSTADNVLWRSIPLQNAHLHTGLSQSHELWDGYYGEPEFFGSASLLIGSSNDDSFASATSMSLPSQSILEQFYDHSLAIHDDIASSQLPAGSFSTLISSFNTTEGIGMDDTTVLSPNPSGHQAHASEVAHLNDLQDIPSAAYLESISPQTMTVNLIVGIISIAEPRTIRTRWGNTMSLVELLVGDETKSGFTITFWLPSRDDPGAGAESREDSVRRLRRQDIVLLRNVALGAFMRKVHGHSLRKGLTKVDLLHRRKLDRDDDGGLYTIRQLSSKKQAHPQLMKARRVWEWALNFVGGGNNNLGKRKIKTRSMRDWEIPPADTQ